MPESENNRNGGGADRRPPPAHVRGRTNRTLMLCLAALLAGYLFSGGTRRWFADNSPAERRFEVMATYGRILVPQGSGAAEPAAAAEAAENAVREVNDLMGPFGPESDVRRLNEAKPGEWITVHPLTWTVVMEALRWHRLSGGAFDPTIGPVKQLFRFDQRETDGWPDEKALADARARVGADKLLYDREGMRLAWKTGGMRLDLGAIAKGFGADRAAEALRAAGVKNALVDIGGELRLLGSRPGDPPSPWRTGVRNPRGGDVLERLDLENAAVATSGDYEGFFLHKGERYEHIIDPRTALPLREGVASVTVVHPDSCLSADALATTLTVLGVEEGKAFLGEQAAGLFAKGVRVILLAVEKDGRLRRVECAVDAAGTLNAEETFLPVPEEGR